MAETAFEQHGGWLSTGDDASLRHVNMGNHAAFDPAGKGIGDREIVAHPHGMSGSWMA